MKSGILVLRQKKVGPAPADWLLNERSLAPQGQGTSPCCDKVMRNKGLMLRALWQPEKMREIFSVTTYNANSERIVFVTIKTRSTSEQNAISCGRGQSVARLSNLTVPSVSAKTTHGNKITFLCMKSQNYLFIFVLAVLLEYSKKYDCVWFMIIMKVFECPCV